MGFQFEQKSMALNDHEQLKHIHVRNEQQPKSNSLEEQHLVHFSSKYLVVTSHNTNHNVTLTQHCTNMPLAYCHGVKTTASVITYHKHTCTVEHFDNS